MSGKFYKQFNSKVFTTEILSQKTVGKCFVTFGMAFTYSRQLFGVENIIDSFCVRLFEKANSCIDLLI